MQYGADDFERLSYEYFGNAVKVEENPEVISGVFFDEPDMLADEAQSVALYRAARGLLP